jgi:hypothetical protein
MFQILTNAAVTLAKMVARVSIKSWTSCVNVPVAGQENIVKKVSIDKFLLSFYGYLSVGW